MVREIKNSVSAKKQISVAQVAVKKCNNYSELCISVVLKTEI